MDKDWLANLQVGDEVYIQGLGLSESRILKVTRLTKTMIMVGPHESRYRKVDGISVSSHGFHRDSIRPVTPENKSQVMHDTLVRMFKNTNWKSFDLETLQAIQKVILPKEKP